MPGRSLVVPNQIRAQALRKAELWPLKLRPQLRAEKACGWTRLAVSGCRVLSEQKNKETECYLCLTSWFWTRQPMKATHCFTRETLQGWQWYGRQHQVYGQQTHHKKGYKPLTSLCITSHTAHIQRYNHACVAILWNTLLEHIYH